MGMSRAQIEDELRAILLKIIDVDPEAVTPDANFFQDLEMDSIKAIEAVVAIDKHFKVSLNEDIAQMTTLAKTSEIIFNILDKR